VDVDRDGDLDVYLIHYQGPNQVHRNEGGEMVPVAPPEGSGRVGAATGATFADLDADGRMDLFVTYRFNLPKALHLGYGHADGEGRPRPASSVQGGQESFSVTPFDYDSDGDLDLYVCGYRSASLLHRNEGYGAFRQVAEEAGLHRNGPAVAAFPADYDNDGDLDLYVIQGDEEPNQLFRNEGGTRFTEVAGQAGVDAATIGTGASWGDYDNDGDLDLLVSTIGGPILYENEGDGRFADVTEEGLDAATLLDPPVTAGAAAADYDGDGDVDVFLAGIAGPDVLLRNDSPATGHWLRLELAGRRGQQDALGARVHVRVGEQRQIREQVIASLLGSTHGDLLHFGLGAAGVADEVVVDWPSGARQVLLQVPADQVLRIAEPVHAQDLRLRVLHPAEAPAWGQVTAEVEVENVGSQAAGGAAVALQIEAAGRRLHASRTAVPRLGPGETARLQLPGWRPPSSGVYRFAVALEGADEQPGDNGWERTFPMHQFVDVAQEVGLDGTHNGWAGAWADYDGDGDQDLYLSGGGTSGLGASRLLRSEAGESFTDVTAGSGTADQGNGTGAAVADLNGDGLVDIFLAKGGFVGNGEASRLLHNRGDGTFVDASSESGLEEVLPSYGAAAGDYDQDGDLDLYVPRAPGWPNALFRNDGDGAFSDVGLAHGIRSFSLYGGSAATFVDLDNDGDLDLYAGMWGFHDVYYTNWGAEGFGAARLGEHELTSGVAAGDYDNDGDLDLFVANAGGRSTLYRNELDSHVLSDVGAESGTENFGAASGCAFGDVDNDGDLDLGPEARCRPSGTHRPTSCWRSPRVRTR
ncbi:MAG: VCBS repeat-containing protein, partial [Candidatus Latescibacterota bacterium]